MARFGTSAVSRFAPTALCTTSISLMAAAGTAVEVGVTPNGNGPPLHFVLVDATAPLMALMTFPEASVNRQVSGVIDTSWPVAKSRTQLRTTCPWAFAILPTPLVKVVMHAWVAVETCGAAGAVSPQSDARAMKDATWRVVRYSAMPFLSRQGMLMPDDRPGVGTQPHAIPSVQEKNTWKAK